ncbi:hypothetical protein [Sulfuricystis thermophila]|uniref:hypothetical protein n=1 Tax=Sulfuricystis thermophila TaxID=2496847 RepID=UPI001035A720|nr:hypothetical protein [Sulfuricystis thermophila]
MRSHIPESGPLAKLFSVILGAALLVVGFMFSLVVLAIAVVVGLVVWGWFWWRTRRLRQARRAGPAPSDTGQVIDGEAVVVEERITRVISSRSSASPDRHSPD